MSNFAGFSSNSAGSAPDRDEVQREVADDLRRRGHLDDVAEDVVGGGVHVLDLLELLAEAERDRLLAQVGELAAGDLVGVDAAGRRRQAGLERRVDAAGGLPVGLEGADRVEVEPGLAVGVVGGGDQRRQRRLARRAGHRGAGGVDRVDARRRSPRAASRAGRPGCRGCAGAPAGRSARAARVTSVAGGGGAQQPGHVLDREHVRAGVDDPLGEAAGSSRACRASRPGRTGRRCSRARPRRPSCRSRAPPRSPGASARRR